MNTSDFLKEINVLFVNYNKQQDKDMLNTWYEMLKDYDYRLLQKAITKIMAQSKYMPTVKDILDTIKDLPYEKFTDEEKTKQWSKEGIKPSWLKRSDINEK